MLEPRLADLDIQLHSGLTVEENIFQAQECNFVREKNEFKSVGAGNKKKI